jgi:hypothetical protein
MDAAKVKQIAEISGLVVQLLPVVAAGSIQAYTHVRSLIDAIRPEGDVKDEAIEAARAYGAAELAKLRTRAEEAKAFLASQA